MFLGKRPVARVSAHPPIFAAELLAPMVTYPAEYGNGSSWHVWLFHFVRLLAAKGSETMPVLTTVEAQLSLHKRNIAKAAPEAPEWQETRG